MARPWIFVVLILLVGNVVFGQWYTDPHNPEPVCPHVQVRGGLVPDINGGAYFFIEGPNWCSMMSHVCIDGQWSCPLPGVIIGPPTSAFSHDEAVDPDNDLISHVTNAGEPSIPSSPSLLNKWSASGNPLWQTFTFPDTITRPHYILSNRTGGCLTAIIYGTGMGISWYIQYFDSTGQPQLGWFERPLLGTGLLCPASLISDGLGGGIAAWQDQADSTRHVRIQHVRSDGGFAFPDSGIRIIENGNFFNHIYCSSPGSFILEWTRPPMQYHCTRFDSSGVIMWDHLRTGWNYITTDRLGGLYFYQEDDTSYGRIDALGEVVFSGRPLPILPFQGAYQTVSISGELVILYWDESVEVWDLQKYDPLGNEAWTQPVPVLYGMPSGNYPYIEYMAADERGGVVLCFIRPSGTYFTRVDAYGNIGSSLYVNTDRNTPTPTVLEITAYPNPFNSHINIMWTRQMGGAKCLGIHNLLGQRVLSVHLPTLATKYSWDGRDSRGYLLPSGTYYSTLQFENQTQTISITLIK